MNDIVAGKQGLQGKGLGIPNKLGVSKMGFSAHVAMSLLFLN
jgi:hypothetical protein